MKRARLMAARAMRWHLAQLPDRLREKSLPWLVVSLWSRWMSL